MLAEIGAIGGQEQGQAAPAGGVGGTCPMWSDMGAAAGQMQSVGGHLPMYWILPVGGMNLQAIFYLPLFYCLKQLCRATPG